MLTQPGGYVLRLAARHKSEKNSDLRRADRAGFEIRKAMRRLPAACEDVVNLTGDGQELTIH